MIKRPRNHVLWTIFMIVGMVAAFITYGLNKIDFKELITILIAVFTVYTSLLKQSVEDDKVFRDLFIDYNRKYSSEMNEVFNKLRIGGVDQLEVTDRLLIIDYFNLCSEEYLWYKRGRIPNDVWQAWEAGIIENMSLPVVKVLFNDETNTLSKRKSYYGFAEYLKTKQLS
jgi:hypothetical protein